MELKSVYYFMQQKFGRLDDDDMRRKILGSRDILTRQLARITLLVPDDLFGMKALDLNQLDGFTHTTADTTLLVPNDGSSLSVKQHYQDEGITIVHSDLPLLAVRVAEPTPGYQDHDFVRKPIVNTAALMILVCAGASLLPGAGKQHID